MPIAFQLTAPTPPASPTTDGPRRASEPVPVPVPLTCRRPQLRRASSISDLALARRGPKRKSPYPSMVGAASAATEDSDSEREGDGVESEGLEGEGDVESAAEECATGRDEEERGSRVAMSWVAWLEGEKAAGGRNSNFYDSVPDSLVKHRKRLPVHHTRIRRHPPPALLQLRPAHNRCLASDGNGSDDDLAHAMQLTSYNLHALDHWTNPFRALLSRTRTVDTTHSRSAATTATSPSSHSSGASDARSPSLGLNRSFGSSGATTLVSSASSTGWTKFEVDGFGDGELDLGLGLLDQFNLALRRAASGQGRAGWDFDGVGEHCERAVLGEPTEDRRNGVEEGWTMLECVLLVALAVLVKVWLAGGAAWVVADAATVAAAA